MKLYEELGVKKDASPEEIKKAYRARAKKTHPDKHGGDPELFNKVNVAYSILINPERKKRYDETGDTDEKRELSIQELAMENLRVIIDNILKNNTSNDSILYADIFDRLEDQINAQIENAEMQIEEHQKRYEVLIKMEGRVKYKGAAKSLFLEMIKNEKLNIENSISNTEKNIKVFEALIVIIDDYEFNPLEREETFDHFIHGNVESSGTSGTFKYTTNTR